MPTLDPRILALKEEIIQAFSDVPYPGDDHIAKEHCWEEEEVADAFRGKRWQDWKDKPLELIAPQGSLSFFYKEAWHYYLPLHLIASIVDYDDANPIPGNLIFDFTPTEESGFKSFRTLGQERIPLLSRRQLKAVIETLKILKEKESRYFLEELDKAIAFVEGVMKEKS